MKKVKYLVIAILALFVVTGCGSKEKTLECTSNSEQNSIVDMNRAIKVTFNDQDKVKGVKLSIDVKLLDDSYKSVWGELVSGIESEYKATSKTGIKLTTKNDDKKYKYNLTLDIDLEKASKEDLAEYGLSDLVGTEETYDSLKKSAEASGLTCK